ncbi:ABC transporter permease [Tunturiibacter gelidoferens]|uniref:Permease n=1 Tax=Tunturiibacter gelidiferens TaxID=3069689 RepID=A0A9X0QHK7_9BACT|nr:ABC transporter permease [Edaphobacter lichenicola]MBB5330521.1 putative permease [Edaphobacter lichenicola]
MRSLFSDLKIAIRHLSKSPGFAATAILMLALAIGATTAIFSLVEGVLLRPLPFPDPSRLVVLADILKGLDTGGGNNEAGVTAPDIRNYTRDTHSFTSLGGYQTTSYEFSGVGDPANVNAARMSGGVFPALAVQPLMGRFFTQQEDDQHQQVIVLSYATWQTRFQGDPNVLGRKVLLDRKPYLIIGVMPRNFEFPLVPGHLNRSEFWVPISFRPEELGIGAASWNFQMVGRLKPGVTIPQAIEDANVVAKETVRNYPAFMAGFSITSIVRQLDEETVAEARPLVRTLFLAVAVVLLIACANLAGLLLVRSIRRRREIAVRLALGASSSTLLWQAILESLVLSVSGGVLGLILAAVALRVGIQALPETLPRVSEIGLDWPVVVFALGLAIITGVLCGLAPAFAAIRTSVNDTLKEGGRTGTSGGGHARLRSALVVSEIAVALVLLTASGLLLRSFEKMRQVDLGFQPDHTLVASYSLPRQQYGNQTVVNEFSHQLLARLQALPGVKSVGLTTFLPASGNNSSSAFVAEGHVLPPAAGGLDLGTSISVQGDYFRAVGIPLLQGRLFTPDDNASQPPVVIVNHMLAQQSWPNQSPIGKRFRIGSESMTTPWATVVGEVADVKENSPDLPLKQQYYKPVEQEEAMAGSLGSPTDISGDGGYIAVRTSLAPEQMENLLRSTVHSIDPQLPLTQVQSMEHALSDTEAPRRFNTALISSFAFIAVLLAVLGIYSVIAFSVALRVQEMAIRMALGSQRAGIVRLVVISGAKLAFIGCAIGLVGAFAASRLIKTFLFGVSAFDPIVLTLATLSLLLLALAASLLPARRAASVDLTQALRSE